MGIPFLVFLAAVGAIVVFVVVSYNRLVSLTQRSQSSWSDVDVQLKRRTDLVPNLGESVKGYAAHERGTLDAVVRARSASFQSLQASLGEIEESVQNARRYFNAVVRDLNTTIQVFPSNLVAGFFQFRSRAYFELDRPDERQVPKVSFGS
jgi:LemA protein